MASEPMFNYKERAPLILVAVLILIFCFTRYGPSATVNYINSWWVLIPFSTPGVTLLRQVMSLTGHGLLHANWGHVLMNSAMILVFSVMTIRAIRTEQKNARILRYFAIFFLGVVMGGLFQWGWWGISNTVNAAAIGASGGASTFFAAAGWAMGGRKMMFQYGAAWIVLNIIFVVAEPIFGISMAWAAHLGGYFMGMVLAPLWLKPNSTGFSIIR